MEKNFFAKITEAIKTFIVVIIAVALSGSSLLVLNFLSCINPFFVGYRSCSYTETTPSSYTDSYQHEYSEEHYPYYREE
jgi:hypothetical protein